MLAWVRWVTIAALLLITVVQPQTGRFGLPVSGLVLSFALYNLVLQFSNRWLSRQHFILLQSSLDVVVAALLYALGGEPGSPLFVLFFLAVICTAARVSLRASTLYTALILAVVVAIDLSFTAPTSSYPLTDIHHLGTRLVLLGLVGVGMGTIARRQVLEEEISRAAQSETARLTELDRLRTEFVSTVSHELRTPLTAVQAGIGLLETSAADRLRTEEQELLGNVRRNVNRLGLLIDDLLAFNQLRAGALVLTKERLDLREVVADALSSVHPLIQRKEQSLELDLPEPLILEGDWRRLEQVIVNLLANAHQHTPAGTRISVAGRVTEGRIFLSVRDTGPGIPTEELEAIFKRFYRVEPTSEGSGLGLAIARSIIELHGGQVWADSTPGTGTTFHFALPQE